MTDEPEAEKPAPEQTTELPDPGTRRTPMIGRLAPDGHTDRFVRFQELEVPRTGSPDATAPLVTPDDMEPPSGPSDAAIRAWVLLEGQAEEVLKVGERICQPVETKINAIRLAMDLFARTRHEAEERLAGLPPDVQPLIRALLGRAASNPRLARQMQVACFQYSDATRALDALRERLKRAGELEPPASTVFLEALPLPKVRGKYYIVTNFNVTFRGDPLLGKLFPPRSPNKQTAPAGTEPGKNTTELPSTAKATGPIPEAGFWDTVRGKLGRQKPKS
ncbi:MAG: hypothetical protein JWM80_3550 [Cyanobacteria bacterium RYN_339]|nr:hypothetical protein [Cyanobacteria bacterium RYN_339]